MHGQFLQDGRDQLPAPIEGDEGHGLAIEPADEGGGFVGCAGGLVLKLSQGGNEVGVFEFAHRFEGFEAKPKRGRRSREDLTGDGQAFAGVSAAESVFEEDFAGRHGDLRIVHQPPGQDAAVLAASGILGGDFPARELELAIGICGREPGRGGEMLEGSCLFAPGEGKMRGGGLVGREVAFFLGDAVQNFRCQLRELRAKRGLGQGGDVREGARGQLQNLLAPTDGFLVLLPVVNIRQDPAGVDAVGRSGQGALRGERGPAQVAFIKSLMSLAQKPAFLPAMIDLGTHPAAGDEKDHPGQHHEESPQVKTLCSAQRRIHFAVGIATAHKGDARVRGRSREMAR